MKSATSILNRPIKIGLLFSIFTLVLFEFGVYDWAIPNKHWFYLFLFVCHVAMYVGFSKGTKEFETCQVKRQVSINKIVRILFWISLILAVPKFFLFTGIRSFSFSSIFSKIAQASTDALSLYQARRDKGNAAGAWMYINWIVILFSPFHWAFIPLSVYYWKKLSAFIKLGTVFIWFLWCSQYIVAGTNVGVFLFVITFGVVRVLKQTSREKKGNINRVIKWLAIAVLLFLVAFILSAFFNMTMGSRIGDSIGSIDKDSLFWILTPPPFRNLVCYITKYLTHAYQAVAYSFSVPFESTYGFGHSFYLLDECDPYHTWLWPRTYNIKIDALFHYDWYSNWHTPYVWFANDVSHFGVPVVFFFLFRFFGRAWRRYRETGNVVSFLVFMMFVEFISFISANNQIFQDNVTLIAFWALVILHRITRKTQFILTTSAI